MTIAPAETFAQAIPADAKYACPMDKHPDQTDPAEQGAYFSATPGDCPWCGMKVKPIDDLAWARARKAAGNAEVAYTCPDHPQVFSRAEGKCPRCEQELEPFKVMYTCPNPKHAGHVQVEAGKCPRDQKSLVTFRGVWLADDMTTRNEPANTGPADEAAFRCPEHPLVHSNDAGNCTICGTPLQSRDEASATPALTIPADATHVCPMSECNYFAGEAGRCPVCGMKIKPIEKVAWARDLPRAKAVNAATSTNKQYVCPMHADETAGTAARCGKCGMRLVPTGALPNPTTVREALQVQMNHLLEHYLELQERFAADRTTGAAQQALGLIAAGDEIKKLLSNSDMEVSAEFRTALAKLNEAAVKMRRENLAADRVAFVDLSAALRTMMQTVRPAKDQYKEIFIFHCPMSKGDWLQTSAEMKNPYYGFEMLKCGELVDTQ